MAPMSAGGAVDPLTYLNRAEKVLVGWSVRRQFATNGPRIARLVERSGSHAAARIACSQTFNFYIVVLGFSGVLLGVLGIRGLAYALYSLAAVCLIWSIACAVSSLGPQRRYRRDLR